MTLTDAVGLTGVALMLVAYAAAAMGRLSPTGATALTMNLVGALFVLYSLIFDFNLAAAVLETAWALVAVVGLVRLALRRKSAEDLKSSFD